MRFAGPADGADPDAALVRVVRIIDRALTLRSNLIDFTDIADWEFLGTVIQMRRDDVLLAYRFGTADANGARLPDSSPAAVRKACDEALWKLGADCIDLFYQEAPDHGTAIEQTMEELKKLVKEGKVKQVGISTNCAATVSRAHAVHPVSVVNLEWSLWKPRGLDAVVTCCRELGVGILAAKPYGSEVPMLENSDTGDVRNEIEDLLEQQGRMLLNKLRNLTRNAQGNHGMKVRELISTQSDRYVSNVQAVIEKQGKEFMERVDSLVGGSNSGIVKFMKRIAQGQQGVFAKRLQKMAFRQKLAVLEQLDSHENRHVEVVKDLEELLNEQKSKAVEKLITFRSRQHEILMLKAEGYLLEPSGLFIPTIKGVLDEQRGELSGEIRIAKAVLNEALLTSVQCVKAATETGVAVKVMRLKNKHNDAVIKKLRSHIDDCDVAKSNTIKCLEAMLQIHKEHLVQEAKSFSTRERGCVLSGIRKLVWQQNFQIVQQVENMLKFRNGSQIIGTSEDNDNDESFSEEAHRFICKINTAIFERVREVGYRRGCSPPSIALAWLGHQGNDVWPTLTVEEVTELEDGVAACRMELTEQELASLCTGVESDIEDLELSELDQNEV